MFCMMLDVAAAVFVPTIIYVLSSTYLYIARDKILNAYAIN